jgi:hypothetical protein
VTVLRASMNTLKPKLEKHIAVISSQNRNPAFSYYLLPTKQWVS